MKDNHPFDQSPAAKECTQQTVQTIDAMVSLISRTYRDCKTNADLVANLLTTAVAVRVRHMALHDPALPSKYCDEVLSNLQSAVDNAFTIAVDFAKRIEAAKALSPEELVNELLRMADKLDKRDLH